MNEIKELVQVVSKHKIKQIDILDQSLDPNSKMGQLYDMLRDDQLSAEEIANKLGYDGSSDRSFHKLKNRLKKRLINTTFFIDINQPTFTDYQKAYNTAYKDWGAVRLLLFRAARQTSMSLAQSIIKTAIRYHFTDIVFLLAKDLRNHFAQHIENEKKYNYYNELYFEYKQHLEGESYIENLINEFVIDLKRNYKNRKTDFQVKYDKLVTHVMSDFNKIPTYRYNLGSYLFIVNVLPHLGRTSEILEINKMAQRYFESLSFTSPLVLNMIHRHDALTNMKLKRYEVAIDKFEKIMDVPTSGSIGWYYNRIYYILSNIHIRNYTQANEILVQCMNHRKFNNLISTYKQFILILEAYLQFILTTQDYESGVSFRIGKFLNEVPKYSKDKRGLNISILIVHFLFLIEQEKYSEAIDRVEALNQYCYRYLRRDKNFRSNAFIKLLIQVTKADFHPIRAQRYAEKYLNKLRSMPMNIADQPLDVEIIPYEDLWYMVIDVLKTNHNIDIKSNNPNTYYTEN